MKLPLRPAPLTGELLTSWLVRLAGANGIKVHTLCAAIMPGESVWNRDFDRIAAPRHFELLSAVTGYAKGRIAAMALRAFAGKLYAPYADLAIVPWILPIGVYHRTRESFGLMCCPLCVKERGYYAAFWRLAWLTVCRTHGVRLIDRCPRCGSPIMFHRSEQGEPSCYNAAFSSLCGSCDYDLVKAVRFHDRDKVLLGVQRLLQEWVSCGYAVFAGRRVASVDLFHMVRAICRTIALHSAKRPQHSKAYQRFEMLGVDARAAAFAEAAPYIADIPTALERMTVQLNLRRSDIMWATAEARCAFSRML